MVKVKKLFLILLIVILLSLPERLLAKETINMILIPLEAPSTMYKKFLPLKRYLEQKLKIQLKIKVARRSSFAVRALKEGSADIAYLCPTLYVEAYKTIPIEPLVKLRVNGSSYYRSVILVRDDSPIKKTIQLADASFVYGRYACPGSGLLPEIMLKRLGITESTMIDMVKLGSDQSAITAVLARMFDATAVAEMLAKTYIGRGLRVLRYSYAIPQYLFVARKSLGADKIKKIKKALLSINNSPDRYTILSSIEDGADGIDPAFDRDYDIVRVLMKTLYPGENFYNHTDSKYIKVYVEPVYFEPEIFVMLEPLIKDLSEKTGLRFKVIVPPSIKEFLKAQKLYKNALFIENYHLAHSISRKLGGTIISILNIKGLTVPSKGLILVRRTSRIHSVEGLKGARVGIPSEYSDGGFRAQLKLLNAYGIHKKDLNLVALGSYDKVLISLYRGEIDAAFVTLTALKSLERDMNTQLFRTLASITIKNNWVMVANKGIKNLLIGKLRAVLSSIYHKNLTTPQ